MEKSEKVENAKKFCKKFPEIPTLSTYGLGASKEFWANFPSNPIPRKPETRIDVEALKKIIESCSPSLLKSEQKRARKCIEYLETGGPAFQKGPLGSCHVKNSKAATQHGEEVTDTIAAWITKKFVAGPFDTPPLPNFRANSILAIPQTNKTRICINVSLPEGRSLNDNVDNLALEKVTMSSAKNFGFSMVNCGKNCVFAKPDIVDAYKNVPARLEDLHLQGFRWENKFFVELRQMFGASSSVQNFDILANTIKTLASVGCDIPRKLIHRQLDDTPIVAPADSGWCKDFYQSYKKICDEINIELAPDCPNKDKSYGPTTKGKVLGIWFDSTTLCWKLPSDKRESTLAAIKKAAVSKEFDTLQLQSLLGRLNFISTMCPFLASFKYNLNACLANTLRGFKAYNSEKVQEDLTVWKRFLTHPNTWIPICPERTDPPLATLSFTSDAAVCPDNSAWTSEIGCGVVGLDANNNTILSYQVWWPKDFITVKRDNRGIRFGNKTSTLEIIGILLPFVLIPEKLRNKHIRVFTDNAACVYGMKDGYIKKDEYASIFIRAITLISGYLGSVVHTMHTPRRSTW